MKRKVASVVSSVAGLAEADPGPADRPKTPDATKKPTFRSVAEKRFAFLCETYGFTVRPPDPSMAFSSVIFEKSPLVVELWRGKGEVDVLVRVTIDTSILRPYRTKTFPLWMIVRRINNAALKNHPPLPQYALSVADADACLEWEAKLMHDNCADLLRGDIKVLEELAGE